MPELPRGTVTFLFTDIEGSTQLWERDRAAMADAVERHIALLDAAINAEGGIHFKTIGDAVQAAFPTASSAVAAALNAQRALLAENWGELGSLRVRMALHAGEAEPGHHGDYLAAPLNRLSRLLSTGHGGQILLSHAVQQLTRGELPRDSSLRDLGEHRLRDLLEPERIFQFLHPALPAAFPPLKTLGSQANNLPMQLTSLLGRDEEIARISALIEQEHARLVTLTGSGGTGKTRIALAVAAELLDGFPDGVWFVDLAPVSSPGLVPSTIASVLGVRETGLQSPSDALAKFLASKRVLLVLDNFEHLLDATSIVSEMLQAGSGVVVLATSREPLRLRGEQELAITPLAVPAPEARLSPETLAQVASVALFVQRAQATKAGFALTQDNAAAIAAICRRLDGLPLALELAAARIKLLPPAALLARLERSLSLLVAGARDAPARQRTLRETIAWSHDLLAPEEQILFRRLGVFAGGWTLEAAEAVANLQGDIDVFDGLTSLVDKSLVRQIEETGAEPRFTMLETIREFAWERLASSDEEGVRAAHADYFLGLAEEAAPWLERDEQVVWHRRLEAEHANVRAAIDWFQAHHDAESILRLGAALWVFWFGRHAEEGLHWLKEALTAAQDADPHLRAAALHGAGNLARDRDAPEEGEAFHQEELALRRAIGDEVGIGKTLLPLGVEALEQEDFARAEELLTESAKRLQVSGDSWALSIAGEALGALARARGDLERARDCYTESLEIARTRGDRYNMAQALSGLGQVAMASADSGTALTFYKESVALQREAGDAPGVAASLGNLALAWIEIGELDRAEALLEEALTVEEGVRSAALRSWLLLLVGQVSRRRGDLGRAARSYSAALDGALKARRHRRSHLAECLDELAAFMATTGAHSQAARLWGTVDALREAIGLWWRRRSELEQTMCAARDAIGEAAFADAREAGRTITAEDAITAAMALVQTAAAEPREGVFARQSEL